MPASRLWSGSRLPLLPPRPLLRLLPEERTVLDPLLLRVRETTARDIAIMSRELLGHEKIKEYTTIWMDTVRGGQFGLNACRRGFFLVGVEHS